MAIHNLSHLKSTVVGEGMEKIGKWGLPVSWEEPNGCLVLPVAPTVGVVYSHCLPILISLIQERTVCHGTGALGWRRPGNEGPVFAGAGWTSCTCATISVDPVAACMGVSRGLRDTWLSGGGNFRR